MDDARFKTSANFLVNNPRKQGRKEDLDTTPTSFTCRSMKYKSIFAFLSSWVSSFLYILFFLFVSLQTNNE